ncbi:MAG: restriction endonuclease, partial [Vicingaceae bacterium]
MIHQVLSLALEVVAQFSKGERLAGHCSQVQFAFPEVMKIKATPALFDKIPQSRKTAPYSYALELARLIILNYSPDIKGGKEKMLSLLFDMNQLWEEFVTKELRRHLETQDGDFEVLGQDSKSFISGHTIRPDIVVKQYGKDTCIIDTKWKLPKDQKASVTDLRQMYAYARYWNVKKVILLYPGDKDKSMKFSEYITDDYSKPSEDQHPNEITHE